MRAAFSKLTEKKMVVGLMHGGSTQRVESLNHLRATVRPKYQHHAGSDVADQRHNLGDLRWNEKRFGSTQAALAELGVESAGQYCEQALKYLDSESRADSQRKATIEGKQKRKANRKKRTSDTNAVEDGAYGPQTERNQITSLSPVPTPEVAAGVKYDGTLDAAMSMPARALVTHPPYTPLPSYTHPSPPPPSASSLQSHPAPQVLVWDIKHTGTDGGETYLDFEVWEIGAKLLRWTGGKHPKLEPVDTSKLASLVQCMRPMSSYVREHMLGSRPPAEQVTVQQLLGRAETCRHTYRLASANRELQTRFV